jgi:eukaryotic translation initiation factor 2C
MDPSQKFPVKGRSFFTPNETRSIGGGLILWRGYFQSIRPAIHRMLINVDISTGVMDQPGPLLSLGLAFLDRNDPNLLSAAMPDRERVALTRFIAGVRVQTQDAGTGAQRARVVRKLSTQGASQTSFIMRGGRSMTVAKYFQDTTGKALRFPSLLCVEVRSMTCFISESSTDVNDVMQIGQGALIPLELCTVLPGQLVKKEVPDDKKAALVEFATMAPKDRLASIKKGLEVRFFVHF